MKFLIDECLSLDLVEVARGRGFVESSHVVWMGKAGWKDWELKPFILEGDWTFVTQNSVDFRGPAHATWAGGQFADVPRHAGLICINGPDAMSAEVQCELFEAVLDEIGTSRNWSTKLSKLISISMTNSRFIAIRCLRKPIEKTGDQPKSGILAAPASCGAETLLIAQKSGASRLV